jgi:DNA-binding response OmpR family regulator
MSSRAGEKDRKMAREIGASSYIIKPVEEGALIQEVERLIGRAAAMHQWNRGH